MVQNVGCEAVSPIPPEGHGVAEPSLHGEHEIGRAMTTSFPHSCPHCPPLHSCLHCHPHAALLLAVAGRTALCCGTVVTKSTSREVLVVFCCPSGWNAERLCSGSRLVPSSPTHDPAAPVMDKAVKDFGATSSSPRVLPQRTWHGLATCASALHHASTKGHLPQHLSL